MSERAFELTSHLQSEPDQVWAAVKRPALFLHVAAPLVHFKPIGMDRFPETWEEREYRGSMRLLGVLPLGWQAIVISFPQTQEGVWSLRDDGYSPMLPKWEHVIEIAAAPEGGTRYSDRIRFDAGVLTPVSALSIRMFFRHRQRRLRALDKIGFSTLKD